MPLFTLAMVALACVTLFPSPVQTPSPPATNTPPPPSAAPTAVLTPTLPESTLPPEIQTPTPETFPLPGDLGEDIPIAGRTHIEEGAQASDWNSDPPTSGEHYGRWANAGFYDEAIPDGYLIHNMEHGYIIIYFNCEWADMDCESFKTAIEAAMAAAGNDPNTNTVKLIAVPRPGMDNPITYASWGHLYKAETFVPEELVLYVQLYRSNPNYAPEWNLP